MYYNNTNVNVKLKEIIINYYFILLFSKFWIQLIKSKESRRRPSEPMHVTTTTPRTYATTTVASSSDNVPMYEIVNVKNDQDMMSSVVLTNVEGMTEDMLVGLDHHFTVDNNSTNKDVENEVGEEGEELPEHHHHESQHLQGIKQETGNIVYTIAADQSVVIKSEANNGMDDNVLYFITL